jgi:hypothetical protein
MPRRLVPVLATALAILLAGCTSTGGPTTWTATFPADATAEADPIPISLIDQTGLVTGMALAPAGTGESHVTLDPTDPLALRMDWAGSNCDGRISAVMSASGDGYTVTIHVNPSVAGGFGCTAVPVLRAIAIHVRKPIDPGTFTIVQVYP